MFTQTKHLLRAATLAAFLGPAAAIAQVDKLLADDGAPDDSLGYAVAMSGTTLVVGAWQNDSVRANSGAVYVFEKTPLADRWREVAKLIPDDDDFAGDQFGVAVAIDGNFIVVGAPFDDDSGNDRGAVYVFERTPQRPVPFSQRAKLFAKDAAFRDFFGLAVAISGERIVVGAPEDDDFGSRSGSAYVFDRHPVSGNWFQAAKLTPNDSEANDEFGHAVAVSGHTVVVGSAQHDHEGVNNSGAAFVFEPSGSGWVQTAVLGALDGDEKDQLGYAVAVDGDRALIGAPFDDDEDTAGGSVYLFERVGGSDLWTQVEKLDPQDADLGDQFGHAVALSGPRALVGAIQDDDQGDESGTAYVFALSAGQWIEQPKLLAGDGEAFDEFGFAVALEGDLAVVGAPNDDDGGDDESGSASVFRLPSDVLFSDSFEQ